MTLNTESRNVKCHQKKTNKQTDITIQLLAATHYTF